ncbi:efflux RND transporter permease subunit [Usitatibacter palustris]|uniref:Multidrug resistance protein MdtC n=1 Tax=Usitatibacter palustris TaxID=2732487 RepID=A0A6M4HA44_9PROT|nr:efflux RND transporter permease subunit [Usitatibacter palustris]QJR16122.1 Multidrug resistance protein MdtC [Usitatibacter palustris]
MFITRVSINNPVFATMMMVALCVLGIFSYNRLRVERMPDFNNPNVYISVAYPGAAPEAIENDITKPIEEAINSVNGVKMIRSNTLEGRAETYVEFRLDADMARSIQDVRDKIAAIRPGFPRDAKEPLVVRSDSENSSPVMWLAVTSPTRSLRELSTLTDQVIVKRLQNVAGVGQIDSGGGVTRQVQIQLKPSQMHSQGVGVDEIMGAIRAANMDVPAGRVENGPTEQLVRVEGKIKNPAGFGRIIVARRANGPVYLEQVADIVDGEREASSLSRLNGTPAITIDVLKVQDANIVEVGNGVKKALEDLKKVLPPDVKIQITGASVDWIEKALSGMKTTILEGALLTIFIVFLFLHSWRSTIITGLTLPIAVIATFVAVYVFGFTLNFLTLMALSLCIGLLIDDAIVVRENIVRHLAMGKDHYRAAKEGTEEIGLAVMATTFAIVAVFIPVAFMSGFIGKIFFQFGITVAVAVLVSLFVSFTLDPMLSAIWHDPPGNRFKRLPWLAKVMDKVEAGIEWAHHRYGVLLEWSLLNRLKVLATALVIFISSFFVLPLIGTEFVPETDEGFVSFRLTTPVGSSLEYTDAKTRQVEEIVRTFPEVEFMTARVGAWEGRNSARVNVQLVDRHKVKRPSQKDFETKARKKIQTIPGIELSVGWNRPIWINILGNNNEALQNLSDELLEKIAKIPGIVDLESSLKASNPAITMKVNNELASDLGLTVQQIGNAVRPFVAGDVVSYWLAPDGQNYEVNVQLPRDGRRIASDLGDLRVVSSKPAADGSPVLIPLRQVVDFQNSTSPQIIKRQELQRRVGIYANVEGRPSGTVGDEVKALLKTIELPPGTRFDVAGQQQEMQESFQAAVAALGMAVIFIYIILASQFGSFLQPVAIMASLPFTLIGVFLALLLTGTTLNVFSVIGIIMLMGLVTKNAILLVDFTNQGMKAGKSRHDAILEAGQVRLRPILMTTAAMVFGMLPMAIGSSDGGEQNAPMGRAVIGGIITSTLLTLVVVPVIFTYLDSFGRWVSARLTRSRPTHAAVPQEGDD